MGLDAFIAELAKSKNDQTELKQLAEFYYSHELPIPDFELVDDGSKIAEVCFSGDSEATRQFLIFAQTHDGSLFAIWNDGPIVYLASEFEGTSVIANSVGELLGLVAYGSDSFTLDMQYVDGDEWGGCDKAPEGLKVFRTWLKDDLQIEPPASPREVVLKARSQHPDLVQWFEARQNG